MDEEQIDHDDFISLLRVLKAFAGGAQTFSFPNKTGIEGRAKLASFGKGFSESGVLARIERFLGQLDLRHVDINRLAPLLGQEIRQANKVSRKRLFEFAKTASDTNPTNGDETSRWRRELEQRLRCYFSSDERVEHLPRDATPVKHEATMELGTLLERLLNSNEWAYAESPSESVRPMCRGDV